MTRGFTSPNFTQCPNDWFDEMLPQMTIAEAKVTAMLIRHTFGFHRLTVEIGMSRLARLTGLSENAVLRGAKAAEARGIVKRVNKGRGDRRRTVWELVVTTSASEVVNEAATSTTEVGLPPPRRQTTSTSEAREIKTKEKKKKEPLTAERTPSAHPALIAYRESAKLNPTQPQSDPIIAAVGDKPEAVAFWKQVVAAYCLQGWNPRNVANMLDYFKRHELPATRRGGKSRSSAGKYDALLKHLEASDGNPG